jgi:hypothetical protein
VVLSFENKGKINLLLFQKQRTAKYTNYIDPTNVKSSKRT